MSNSNRIALGDVFMSYQGYGFYYAALRGPLQEIVRRWPAGQPPPVFRDPNVREAEDGTLVMTVDLPVVGPVFAVIPAGEWCRRPGGAHAGTPS